MTSISRPRTSNQREAYDPYKPNLIGKNICFVVGLVCIAGFLVDVLVLGTPPNPLALEWRADYLQQIGDRCIVLLFGVALLLYSVFDQRHLKRPLALFCTALGVAFLLSSLVIIRDSLTLKDQSLKNISTQEEQIQTRIEESKANGSLPPNISLDQLQQAAQQITNQADAAKQNTSQNIAKQGMASVGNFGVVGLGLVGLGRIGMKRG